MCGPNVCFGTLLCSIHLHALYASHVHTCTPMHAPNLRPSCTAHMHSRTCARTMFTKSHMHQAHLCMRQSQSCVHMHACTKCACFQSACIYRKRACAKRVDVRTYIKRMYRYLFGHAPGACLCRTRACTHVPVQTYEFTNHVHVLHRSRLALCV